MLCVVVWRSVLARFHGFDLGQISYCSRMLALSVHIEVITSETVPALFHFSQKSPRMLLRMGKGIRNGKMEEAMVAE